ncbi:MULTISPECIES: serine/threonine-protein kinase [Streptomyces]|uniref:non-specific serine/threonine protein kinase n=1 Tax=Streptomyces ramulosus TaxID=47762 RepID=A0ABW1FKH1_9ACTN
MAVAAQGEAVIDTHAAAAIGPLLPEDPREIAGYRLLGRVGEGGMGTVYLSRTRGGQPVALKLILPQYRRDAGFRLRFEQEVRAARRVQGYHLVPVVDHDTTGQLPWIASEFVPGVPLDAALAEYGPLPLPAVFQLVGCTARALAAIHAAEVVHRDLKPSNIMLAASGPYVIDFGIARAADATQLTSVGGRIGTPHFMSPEHALGEEVGPAGDFFALGLIAAVAATGRHPYGDGGWMTVAAKIANSAVRPPDLSGYPDTLQPLLRRALAVDPAERITADELIALCERGAGRPLRDTDGWLPAPLTAAIERRERAATHPPEPEPGPAGGATAEADRETRPPGAATSAGATRPPFDAETADRTTVPPPPPGPGHTSRAGSGYPPGAGPAYGQGGGTQGYGGGYGPDAGPAYGQGPAAPPASGGALGGPWKHALMAVAAVVLVVLGVVTVKAMLPDGQPDPGPTPTNDPTTATPTPTPTGDPTHSPEPAYKVLVKDRPFALRAPRDSNSTGVDLDVPRVTGGEVDYDADEIEIGDVLKDRWEFRTTMGKGAGETPEKCLEGAQSNALPSSVDEQEFAKTIPVGTLLCTVTDQHNLAMLKVTAVTPTHDGDLPDVETRLTVWKKG